jgi:hypothetical protein
MCKSTNDATVAQFADHVLDGTRCRKDSLDMCIDGKCKVNFLTMIDVIFPNEFRLILEKIYVTFLNNIIK